MNYYIHFGKLFQIESDSKSPCLCYIKSPFYSSEKKVLSQDGKQEMSAEAVQTRQDKSLKGRVYLLKDKDGSPIASGCPQHAADTDPRPISHAPRVDRVLVSLEQAEYCLRMLNSQNFILTAPDGSRSMEILHDGINGGWNILANADFEPMIIMGIYLFTRFLDKENEFVVV